MSPLVLAETPSNSQTSTNSFIVASGNVLAAWDPAIGAADAMGAYKRTMLEGLVWQDVNGDVSPGLAASWTYHNRTDETSSLGLNSGGVAAISFNLRQGVTFHDGSEWNATVCKWNLDRLTNISNYVQPVWKAVHWFDASAVAPRFTASWNLTSEIDKYNATYMAVFNESSTFVPNIKEIIVVSDYVVNVTYNRWSTNVMSYALWHNMISMESYKPWTNIAIQGYGAHPDFPQDNPALFPGHLIGTGPYVFDYADNVVAQNAHGTKYANYWNATALEAAGLFSITDLYIQFFSDVPTRTTALLAGEIDSTGTVTDKDSVIASPITDYIPTTFDSQIDSITMLCQEGLDTPITTGSFAGFTPRMVFPTVFATLIGQPSGTQLPTGVNRTTRRALSYAFDYDGFTNIAYAGGAGVRCTSPFGMNSVWYDPSVPHPDYNITKAREILLADSYMAGLATARGLTIDNTTAEWNAVALSNPIDDFFILSHVDSYKIAFLEQALNDLGFAATFDLVASLTIIWTEFIYTGKAVMYDMIDYLWVNDPVDPIYYMGLEYSSNSRTIPHFMFNYAHLANSTVDGWLSSMYFIADKQAAFNALGDSLINYNAPWIYLGQGQVGFAINSGWTYSDRFVRFGSSTKFSAFFAEIGGSRQSLPVEPPGIPGYPTITILLLSTLTLIGLIVVLKKKIRS